MSLPAEEVEVQNAWKAEIKRRLDEYRAGTMVTYPAADVFAEARRRIRQR